MRKVLFIFLVTLLFAEDNFLEVLNEVSEIATKTKVNVDKTPSNVDVLNRDFIKRSGAKTLIDLLKFIPGIEIAATSSGKKEIIIRGNKSTFRDKIKFMINGVEVTNNLYSNQFYYYNFPAALIKRIEFTKTPDSVLYGGNAFVGVINVITLDSLDDNEMSFYLSNKDEYLGALFVRNNNFWFDTYYSYSNPTMKGKSYLIDVDNWQGTLYREKDANSLEKNFGVGATYEKGKNSISYRLQFYRKGNFFGLTRLIPSEDDKYVNMLHQYLEFKHEHYLRYNVKNEIHVGVKYYSWRGDYRLFPYDFNETIDNNPANDIIAGADVEEGEVYVKDLVHYLTEAHNAIFLVEYKYAKPLTYDYYQEMLGEVYEGKLLNKKVKRAVKSIGLEDIYILNDNFSLSGGVRYDNYSDFGGKFSYKLGGVYNREKDTFKILYNNAYRVPSWVELYSQTISTFNGNKNLRPETINMIESIYIRKFLNSKVKLTYFWGVNSNYIGRKIEDGKKIYDNLGKYYIRGLEFVYDYVKEKMHFNFSYSLNRNYFDFKDEIGGINIYDWPGDRKNMIKSYVDYKIDKRNSVFTSVFWGSKIDVPFVEDVKDYFAINCNYRHKYKNFDFLIGVDNLTNHKNYYWVDPSDLIYNRYIFELEGARYRVDERKFYISLSKRF